MQYEIVLQPEALDDIEIGFEWYEEQRKGLGDSFLREINTCLNKLSNHPLQYSYANKWARKIKVNKFPFLIIFEPTSDKVYVYSVLHTSRNPNY